MRIHSFLIDYRDEQSATDQSTNDMADEINIERDIFENDRSDKGVQPIVVGNDGGRPSGRPSALEKYYNCKV